MDLNTLMALAEKRAQSEADGHFTLMRFTTGWKCFLGTPDLDYGDGREQVLRQQMHPSAENALAAFILERETSAV
jgi:hypothetical protein